MSVSFYYPNNTMIARLNALKDHNDNIITTATVTLTGITDKNGDSVTGVTYPITLSHIGSGLYEGTIDDTLAVTNGQTYKATIKAVNGTDIGQWVETLSARTRAA